MLAMGPSDYNKMLISNMAKVERQARRSAGENAEILEQMPESVKKLMCRKHVALFRCLAEEAGIRDDAQMSGLWSGFNLTGE
eukprot:3082552-Amphidinium_carterae.1